MATPFTQNLAQSDARSSARFGSDCWASKTKPNSFNVRKASANYAFPPRRANRLSGPVVTAARANDAGNLLPTAIHQPVGVQVFFHKLTTLDHCSMRQPFHPRTSPRRSNDNPSGRPPNPPVPPMTPMYHTEKREQLHPAEYLQFMQIAPQHPLRHIVEQEFPIHRPHYTMVNRRPLSCLKKFRSWHLS